MVDPAAVPSALPGHEDRDARAHLGRAIELLSRAASPLLERTPIEIGYRALCRWLLRSIVARLAERRGLRGPAPTLDSIDAGVRAAWSEPLRACIDTLDRAVWLDSASSAALADLVEDAVVEIDRSLDRLGLIHEWLLDHRIVASVEGFTLAPAGSARKRSGTFYTPPDLARATVDKTLAPMLVDRSPAQLLELRICDPAMGGAVFLLATLDRLVEAGGEDSTQRRRELAERCLYGVDLDPIAVELARLALWLAVGDPDLACDFAAARLRQGDALIGLRDAMDREAADRKCARELDPSGPPAELARRWSFFHWSLEFPDVFSGPRAGFDAVIGNPPWEIRKPSSREFFADHDPEYRGRTKQAALDHQRVLLAASPELRAAWTDEQARHRAFSRWVRHAFSHQGLADRSSYKLFVERAHRLLRVGGRMGLIVPSGLYSDKGATELRALLLDQCGWEWLFGFENHAGIFAIHRSFKFAVIVARKGGTTEAVRVAFMRHDLAQWQQLEPASLSYPRARIEQFSPQTRAFVELDHPRDLALLERIQAHAVRLGDASERGWGVRYQREFDMTNDSGSFAPLPSWTARGFRPDEYGHWLAGDWRPLAAFGLAPDRASILERPANLVLSRGGTRAIELGAIRELALPVYEGRMIDQYDFSAKGWVAGSGRSANWRSIEFGPDAASKQVEPQFLMDARELARRRPADDRLTLGIMDVSAATNSRTLIAALTHDRPHGNKVPRLVTTSERDAIELLASLDSLTVDYALRLRLAGLTLNSFILAELPVLARASLPEPLITELLGLALPHVAFARIWRTHGQRSLGWRRSWALTRAERMRRRVIVDALVAAALGLDDADLAWMLRDCDLPLGPEPATPRHPKGFWRVDKHAPVHERHPVLVRAAHRELGERGLADFLVMNEGEGWLPPASLGPRFWAWQLAEDPRTGWAECEQHERLVDAIAQRAR